MDQQACVDQVLELVRAAWALRDALLQEATISPQVVRLEDAIHQLEVYLTRLAPALNATLPARYRPAP